MDPPFFSKPAFKSTLGPGARGVGVGVTVGVVDVEEMITVDETSGVDDTRDEEMTVLLTGTSGVAKELVIEVLEAMMLEDTSVGAGATRVSKKTAVWF